MKACKIGKVLFRDYISEKISPEREEEFLKHIEECPNCRETLKVHKTLSEPYIDLPMPNSMAFSKMRTNVIKRIETEKSRISESWYDVLIEKYNVTLYKPLAAAIILLVVFTLGFFTNRILSNDGDFAKAEIVKNIKQTAVRNSVLSEVEDSPYTFSDVQFRVVDDKNIGLSFDVSTHLDIIKSKDDPVVKEVLAQTLLSPEPLGTRLKSVSISENIMDPKIKEALIFTLHNDNSLAVRMRAMSALMKYKYDKEIQEAFLKLLKEEDSVNMRLMAIEYLAQEKIEKEVLQNAISYLDSGKDLAIRNRINQYLNLK
jgi:hypothetical protein